VNIRQLDLGRPNRVLNAVDARIRRLIKTAQTSEQSTPWKSLVDYMKNNNVTVKALQTRIGGLSMEPKNRQALQSSIAGYDEKRTVDEEVLNSLVNFLYQNENIKNDFMRAVQSNWLLPRAAKNTLLGALNWRLDQIRQQQNRMQTAQQNMLQPGPSQPQPAQGIEKRFQLVMRDFDKDYYYDPVRSCYWLRYRNGPWIGFVPAVPDSSRRLTVVEDSKHGATYRDNATGHHWVQLPNDQWYFVSPPLQQPNYTQFDPQKALKVLPGAKPTHPNIQQPVPKQPK